MNIVGVLCDLEQSSSIFFDVFEDIAMKCCLQIINEAGDQHLDFSTNSHSIDFNFGYFNIIQNYMAFDLIPGPIQTMSLEELDLQSQARIEQFFNDKQIKIIALLRAFLHRTNTKLLTLFLLDLQKKLSESQNISLWCCCVSILQTIPFVDIPDALIDTLVDNKFVFNPSVNIFEIEMEKMKTESQLRTIFIKTLLSLHTIKIKNLFIKCSSHPALFTEICSRILTFVSFSDLHDFFDTSIVDLFAVILTNCLTSFSFYSLKDQKEQNKNEANQKYQKENENGKDLTQREKEFNQKENELIPKEKENELSQKDQKEKDLTQKEKENESIPKELEKENENRKEFNQKDQKENENRKDLTQGEKENENGKDLTQKENGMNVVYKVWSSLMFFIISVFDDENMINLFMNSMLFSQVFLAHSFSKYIHYQVINITKKLLIQQNQQNFLASDNVTQFCYLLLDNNLPIAFEFIDLLQEVISHRPKSTSIFSQLLPSVLQYFNKNSKKEIVQPVLSFILSLSMYNQNLEFTSEQIRKLSISIRESEKSEGSQDTTITTLISIIANSRSINQTNAFVIKKPALIQVLLSASFSRLDSIIQMFNTLCKYSIYNRIQCHNGDLDLFLIEALKNYPNSFSHYGIDYPQNFQQETIDQFVIPTITMLMETKCSLQTAERFISLAIPKKNNIFPALASEYILKLNNMLSSAPLTPQIYDCFTNGKTMYKYEHLPISILKEGFTFTTKIMIDKAMCDRNYEPVIFRCNLGHNMEILVFVSNNSLLCDVHFEGKDNTATFTNAFQSCVWFQFAITFLPYKEESYRVVFSHDKDQNDMFIVRKPNFKSEEWTLEI